MPKISVIIPVYKVEDYLNRCVDSVINQTHKEIEIILVDDGSPDNCGKICDKYAAEYSFVKAIHIKNSGVSAARNIGIDYVLNEAHSDYIAFLDSDDFLHPQAYEIMLDVMKRANTEIGAFYYRFVMPFSPVDFKAYNSGDLNSYEVFNCTDILNSLPGFENRVSFISSCMKLYKTSVFENIRFLTDYRNEDSIIFPYLLKCTSKIARTKLPLYFWTVREDSVTHSGLTKDTFSYMYVYYDWSLFSEKEGNHQISRYYKRKFMNACVYYNILLKEKAELSSFFRPYKNLYKKNYLKFLFNSEFCKTEFLMHLLYFCKIPLYKKLFVELNPNALENRQNYRI